MNVRITKDKNRCRWCADRRHLCVQSLLCLESNSAHLPARVLCNITAALCRNRMPRCWYTSAYGGRCSRSVNVAFAKHVNQLQIIRPLRLIFSSWWIRPTAGRAICTSLRYAAARQVPEYFVQICVMGALRPTHMARL